MRPQLVERNQAGCQQRSRTPPANPITLRRRPRRQSEEEATSRYDTVVANGRVITCGLLAPSEFFKRPPSGRQAVART